MRQLLLPLFLLLIVIDGFSQRGRVHHSDSMLYQTDPLTSLYQKITNTETISAFRSNHCTTIEIGSNHFQINMDSCSTLLSLSPYKEVLHVFNFVGHPVLGDSIRGKFVMFTSICADGSCAYESSEKLFFEFNTDTVAKKFLVNLVAIILPLSSKHWYAKTDNVEKYEFVSDLQPDRYNPGVMVYRQTVILELRPVGNAYEIYFGDYTR
jgi:hypothetical protein